MKQFVALLVLIGFGVAIYMVFVNETQVAPVPGQPAQTQGQKPLPRESQMHQKAAWPFETAGSKDATGLENNLTAKNYIMIFDGSGSMADQKCSGNNSKLAVAQEAVVEWSKSVPADANLGLLGFSNNKWIQLPLDTGNREEFIAKIRSVFAAGSTPLTQAVDHCYKVLTRQGQRQLGYGEYTIVVVTDGVANDPKTLAQSVNKILDKAPISIFTIGFCIGEDHSLNQAGRTTYRQANDPSQLRQGLYEVLAESEAFDDADFTN